MPDGVLIELAGSEAADAEVTVYVKGFLARDEEADQFGAWLTCHRSLQLRLAWGPRASGYTWRSGQVAAVSLPVLSAARIAWDLFRTLRGVGRLNVATHLGWFAGEQAVTLVARFIAQYVAAARVAQESADELAAHLARLAERRARVRIVAHSLGCLQVIEAVSRLSPEQRPFAVHLCAPACREDLVEAKLACLGREQTHLYYTTQDLVLEAAFRVMSWGRALGAVGPRQQHEGLIAVDVGEHFGFWVHAEYKNRFGDFAGL